MQRPQYGFQISKSKANSFRASEVELFVLELNKERLGTKYKPLAARTVAVKVSHVPTNELHDFYQQCMRYKKEKGQAFSKCFWGALKVKKT